MLTGNLTWKKAQVSCSGPRWLNQSIRTSTAHACKASKPKPFPGLLALAASMLLAVQTRGMVCTVATRCKCSLQAVLGTMKEQSEKSRDRHLGQISLRTATLWELRRDWEFPHSLLPGLPSLPQKGLWMQKLSTHSLSKAPGTMHFSKERH